jgi:hypothetical protein
VAQAVKVVPVGAAELDETLSGEEETEAATAAPVWGWKDLIGSAVVVTAIVCAYLYFRG